MRFKRTMTFMTFIVLFGIMLIFGSQIFASEISKCQDKIIKIEYGFWFTADRKVFLNGVNVGVNYVGGDNKEIFIPGKTKDYFNDVKNCAKDEYRVSTV